MTKGYRWQAALMFVFTGGYLGHRLAGKPIDFGFVTNKDSLRLLAHAREMVEVFDSNQVPPVLTSQPH